jgi:hypothetical protein
MVVLVLTWNILRCAAWRQIVGPGSPSRAQAEIIAVLGMEVSFMNRIRLNEHSHMATHQHPPSFPPDNGTSPCSAWPCWSTWHHAYSDKMAPRMHRHTDRMQTLASKPPWRHRHPQRLCRSASSALRQRSRRRVLYPMRRPCTNQSHVPSRCTLPVMNTSHFRSSTTASTTG